MISNGTIKDIFKAQIDLKNKILKHISKHFSDDPLRILRLARFWNKYYNKGFLISANTYFLIKNILSNNDMYYLSNERILKEFQLALNFKHNIYFLNFLYLSTILINIFNDIHLLINFSILKKFNIYLNLWEQTRNIYVHTNLTNTHIKLLLLFLKSRTAMFNKVPYKNTITTYKIYSYYKKKFFLSKKHILYITNLTLLTFLFNKICQIKTHNPIMILNKIKTSKNKITIINNLVICAINNYTNDHIYFFYKKYLLLEILNINIHIKNKSTNKINLNIMKLNIFNKIIILN